MLDYYMLFITTVAAGKCVIKDIIKIYRNYTEPE